LIYPPNACKGRSAQIGDVSELIHHRKHDRKIRKAITETGNIFFFNGMSIAGMFSKTDLLSEVWLNFCTNQHVFQFVIKAQNQIKSGAIDHLFIHIRTVTDTMIFSITVGF